MRTSPTLGGVFALALATLAFLSRIGALRSAVRTMSDPPLLSGLCVVLLAGLARLVPTAGTNITASEMTSAAMRIASCSLLSFGSRGGGTGG